MLKNEIGSVITEYAVVTSIMAIAVFLFWHYAIYSPEEDEFIELGLDLQLFFQQLVNGIALPIP